MRPVVLITCLLTLLCAGVAIVIGTIPLSPTTQHVEQRIPDAQIPR